MISETPLPMPCSVNISPIHIANIVPAVMLIIIVSVGSRASPLKPQLVSTAPVPVPNGRLSRVDWPIACKIASGIVR